VGRAQGSWKCPGRSLKHVLPLPRHPRQQERDRSPALLSRPAAGTKMQCGRSRSRPSRRPQRPALSCGALATTPTPINPQAYKSDCHPRAEGAYSSPARMCMRDGVACWLGWETRGFTDAIARLLGTRSSIRAAVSRRSRGGDHRETEIDVRARRSCVRPRC
jgi:hypothetical protein